MPACMASQKGVATSTEDPTESPGLHDEEEEGASITTTTQGAPYAIKYERIVDDDEEYNELEIEEEADELVSNDGSLFEEDHVADRQVGTVEFGNEEELVLTDQKKVIKLQTINVRGLQNGGLRKARQESLAEDTEEHPVHVVKREVDSDEEYVYPPKKRSKFTNHSLSRKKRRAARGGRAGPSSATGSEKEAKLNVVRQAEERAKPRRILLQSGGGVSKTLPGSCRNASVQCNIPRLDPIKEGILAEMSLINDLFKLEVQEILNRPRMRRKKRSVRLGMSPPSWRQHDRQCTSKSVVDTLRVVKKEITEDDTVEIIVCDSSCV